MRKQRFFKASSFSVEYLKGFHAGNPGLVAMGYADHYDALMSDCFGWADFWKRNLEATGRFECADVVVNAGALQQKWARENGVNWSEANWASDILLAQLQRYQPDVFFAHDVSTITPEFLRRVRREVPSIRLIVGWDGVAHLDPKKFSECEVMLAPVPHIADYYRRHGFRSHLFTLGFEADILPRIPEVPRSVDCSFVGSIFLGAHEARFRTVAAIARQHPVDLHLSVSRGRFLRSRIGLVKRGDHGALWRIGRSWSDYRLLCRQSSPPLFGRAMYAKLAESRVGLNVHIDAARDNSGNMRLFEVTGIGACLLTDRKQNLGELFEEGKEIVVFDNPDDAVDKLKWLLASPERCALIAAAGQARTLRDHSLARSIKSFVEKFLPSDEDVPLQHSSETKSV